jgi:hypothetical protein
LSSLVGHKIPDESVRNQFLNFAFFETSQAEGNDKEGTSSLSPPERRREKIEIGSFLKGLCVEVAIGKTFQPIHFKLQSGYWKF